MLEGYLLGKTGFPKITGRTRLARIFNCDRKTIYNEIKRGTVEMAIVAVARKLAELMYTILKNGMSYEKRTSPAFSTKKLADEALA